MSEEMVLTIYSHIGDKPAIYITNRINSYSVDPTLYKNLSLVKNIKGFGIVIYENRTFNSIKVEKLFYKNEFKYFTSIKDATLWGTHILANNVLTKVN